MERLEWKQICVWWRLLNGVLSTHFVVGAERAAPGVYGSYLKFIVVPMHVVVILLRHIYSSCAGTNAASGYYSDGTYIRHWNSVTLIFIQI
jgi:hypothetical protein